MEKAKKETPGRLLRWVLPIAVITGFSTLIYFTRFDGQSFAALFSTTNKDLAGIKENNAAVNDYLNFVSQKAGRKKTVGAYISPALVKLATATSAAAGFANVDTGGNLERAKAYAVRINGGHSQTNQAGHLRKSADLLSNTLYKVQKSGYPELAGEASALKNAALKIDMKVVISQQTKQVDDFFLAAAALLRKMN